MPLLLDIASFLEASGYVEGDGVDLFRDFIPEMPNTLVALMEYSGDPVSMLDPTVHRSVQIISRHVDADEARQMLLNIFEYFISNQDETGRINFTPTRWGQVYLRQTPFKYKTDDNNRVYYCFNLGITTTIE